MAMFKGDGEGLVDLLIAASAARPAASSYTGYGRELVPWCDDEAAAVCSGPLERRGGSGAERKGAKHARGAGTFPAAPAKPINSKRSKTQQAQQPAFYQVSSTPSGPPRRSSSSDGYSCPSYGNSPKPEKLPMPSSRLLRARSPSPPKDMPFYGYSPVVCAVVA